MEGKGEGRMDGMKKQDNPWFAACVIFIVITAALAVMMGATYLDLVKNRDSLSEANKTIEQQSERIDGLNDGLETMAAQNEGLAEENSSLKKDVAALQAKIDKLNAPMEENRAAAATGRSSGGGLTALQYVELMQEAGLPILNIMEYDEKTDPNGVLGRPGKYIGKVNFADARISQYSEDDPLGGTVEVFATKEDMENRKAYLGTVEQLYSIPLNQYVYPSPDGFAILRVEFDLTPEEGEQYRIAFEEICENGRAAPVAVAG